MNRDGVDKGDNMLLSTGGNPMSVTAGVSSSRAKRGQPISCLSLDAIAELCKCLGLASRGLSKLIKIIKKGGIKVEPYAREQMHQLERKLQDFYDVATVEMTESYEEEVEMNPDKPGRKRKERKVRTVTKNVAYVRDLSLIHI